MAFLFLSSLLWMAASLVMPRRDPAAREAPARPMPPALFKLALYCATSVALLALGFLVNAHSALSHPLYRPIGTVPLGVLIDDGTGDAATSNASLAIGLAEAGCLFGMYRALRGRRVTAAAVAVVAVAAAGMAALALAAPTSNSSDVYGYVAFGLRPATAYAPDRVPFAGDHAAINAMFGFPLQVSPYGPLWLATAHAIVTPFASLRAQIEAMRVFELCALCATAGMLARLRVPFAVLALLLVNPSFYALYVADAHNDLFPVALVLAAMLSVRYAFVRVALVAAAGLVKLPLVVVGAIVFANERSPARRITYAACAIAACLVLSVVFGGKGYFANLFAMSGIAVDAAETLLRRADILLLVGVLAAAIVARTYTTGATWLWSSVAASPTAWYAAWALPYALASGSLATFLAIEPVVADVYAWNYVRTPLTSAFAILFACGPLAYAAFARMRARPSRFIRSSPATS